MKEGSRRTSTALRCSEELNASELFADETRSHCVVKQTERTMKYALAIIAVAGLCAAVPASAEEVGVGVGVGPVGAGVTVGAEHRDRDRERTTIIKEREPRDTTVIKEREREPDRKVIIDHDRN
jgi:hypothetical protein